MNTLCLMAGVGIQEIMEEAEDSRIVPLMQDGGTLLDEVIEWLGNQLKSGDEIPAKAIFEKGIDLGYSQSILKQAKAELGITSKRKERHWTWQWEEGSVIMEPVKKVSKNTKD